MDGGALARLLLTLSLSLPAACAAPDRADRVSQAAEPSAPAECVTFQRGVHGDVADTLLDADAATTSYGGASATRVSQREEALFRVDLSSIPAGSTVTSAQLALYVDGSTDKSPVNFHAATAAWSEATATYQSFAQQYAAAVSGTLTATKTGPRSVDLTALAQAWISGQTPNHGVLAETAPSSKSAAALFASSESDPGTRPALTVCYQPPADPCAGVTCAPLDACHAAGSCNPSTGACTPGALTLTTLAGNATVTTAADAAALACTGAVTGTLTVAADASLPALSLPYLQSVRGLTVTPGSLAGSIALPGLTTSTGLVDVENNAALGSLGLGALTSAYAITIASDANLLSLDLSSLQSVTVDLDFVGTNLATLGPSGLSNLVTVGRNLQILENPNLTTLGPTSLQHLTSVGSPLENGVFTFELNPLVTTLDAGNAVLNGFFVGDNPALQTLRLGPLPASVYEAQIVDQPLLTDLGPTGLSPIQSVTVDMNITNTGLSSLGPTGLGNLVTVGRNLQILQNPQLTDLGPTSLTQLAAVGSPLESGVFTFELNPLVTGIDASNAALNGFFVGENPALRSFRLGNLPAAVYEAQIVDEPLLTDLGPTGLGPIQTVTVDLNVVNTGLATLGPAGLGNLVTVGRNFQVAQNPALTTLGPAGLSRLTAVGSAPAGGGALTLAGNPLLTTADLSALTAVAGNLSVNSDAALSQLLLGSLTHLGGNLQIVADPVLPTCFAGLLGQLVGFGGTVNTSGDGPSCP